MTIPERVDTRFHGLKKHHLAHRVELLGFTSFSRVCRTCYEPRELAALSAASAPVPAFFREGGQAVAEEAD